jgi:hypothetical protein
MEMVAIMLIGFYRCNRGDHAASVDLPLTDERPETAL